MHRTRGAIVVIPVLVLACTLAACGGSSGGGSSGGDSPDAGSPGEAPGGEASPTASLADPTGIVAPVLDAEVPAFPGAEGFGTSTAAGRGGRVCKVFQPGNGGVGSFRHCAEARYPRVIVFEIGGTIELREPVRITHPHVSIYGQTAPGDGILLRGSPESTGAPLEIATHDVLIQHLRLRAGNSTGSTCCRDSLAVGDPDAPVHHVVLDHLSLSWGVDEIAEIWFDTHDVTISRSIFAEGLHDSGSNRDGPAGRGLLIGSDDARSISLHHNFFAHSYQRNPMVKAPGIVDVTNNLIYHWVSRGGAVQTDFGPSRVNFVKNRWIALPDLAGEDEDQRTQVEWGDVTLRRTEHDMRVHFEGNLGHHRTSDDQPQWRIAYTDRDTPYDPALGWHAQTRHPAPPVTEMPAAALETELPLDVGATLPRQDAVDLRLFAQLRDRLGEMPNCVERDEPTFAGDVGDVADGEDVRDDEDEDGYERDGDDVDAASRCDTATEGWPVLAEGQPWPDVDEDGVSDDWEIANGRDPTRADANEDPDGDGYTNLEEWVHSIR